MTMIDWTKQNHADSNNDLRTNATDQPEETGGTQDGVGKIFVLVMLDSRVTLPTKIEPFENWVHGGWESREHNNALYIFQIEDTESRIRLDVCKTSHPNAHGPITSAIGQSWGNWTIVIHFGTNRWLWRSPTVHAFSCGNERIGSW